MVISAPSGAGKTSVLFETLKSHPEIVFSVSSTTRLPREGEHEGVNYHYISEAEFDSLADKGEFLEWNIVHGNKYGTLKRPVEEVVERGGSIILDTDTVGAFNIRKFYPDAVLIFVLPSSPDVLRERLMNRDTETGELIRRRLMNAPGEISRMSEFDYIVINEDLKTAVSQLNAIITAEKIRSSRIFPALTEWRDYINGGARGEKKR